MRNPENVLNSLQEHSAQSGYVYDRLYRNLFNREFFLQAYQNIYASQGNMTAGTDGKTIDAMSLERVDRLIAALKDESYQPKPSRRTYIPKKNGKLRPLGIPSIDDKLVQEVVRMLLESIYENSFEDTSHGFRPNKSCHTALRMIQNRFTRCKWFVEGDIKGFFDNIDHNVMIGILRKRIKDERFLRLIRKFLNAGYMEDNQVHQSYSGTPQGGIISPILANIYLDQFDKYMAEFKKRFDRGNKRAVNVEYRKLSDKRIRLKRKLAKAKTEEEKQSLTTDSGEFKLASFVDEQRMNRLYEKFILEYYTKECPWVTATASQIPWALDDGVGPMLPIMQSDIMLTRGSEVLIIDAKYYTHTTQKQYDIHKIHSSNLYQIFTYVKNKDMEFGVQPHTVSGMLLYAATDEEIQPDNSYQMSGNKISVRTLNLNRDFSEIAAQLNAIVDEHFSGLSDHL